MTLLDILGGEWETGEFPSSRCTIKNPREPNVLDARDDDTYVCLLVDERFGEEVRVLLLVPYVSWETEDSDLEHVVAGAFEGILPKCSDDLLYGWRSRSGNSVYDHKEGQIHCDHEYVVAWKRVDANSFRLACEALYREEEG